MSKRILAALSALLVAASTLVVVASPGGAHTRTTQRCDYDPLSGLSFNCRTVSVSHTHSDNTPSGRNGDSDGPRKGGVESATPEERAEAEKKRQEAEAERKRKEAEAEAERKRKAAEAEAEAERKRKAAEAADAERERKAAEAEAEAERKRKEAAEAERKRCAVSPRPAGCRPHQQKNNNDDDDDDDEPKNGSSMTVSQIIEEFGSVLTCEWTADANDKLGLVCDAVAFAIPMAINGVGGNTNEAEVLRDAGAWAYCYRLRRLPKRVTLACAGITIVADPLAEAIKRFSNIGPSRGNMQPPDPDKTDDSGSDGQPPPTGTTTPDDSGDGSGGGSNGNDRDDLDGDGDFDNDDVNEALRRMARGELDPDEYIRLHRRNQCSKPGHCQ